MSPGLTPSSSDNFTPAQHKEKDEEVTQAASGLGESSELTKVECAYLLQHITEHSEEKLQRFADNNKAIEFIRKNSKLETALKNAWRTKNYQEIRKSGERRASLVGSYRFFSTRSWQSY